MNRIQFAIFVLSAFLAGPQSAAWAIDTYSYPNEPKQFVTDSGITTAIQAKLAGDAQTRFGDIKVDTDENGVVWLSGAATTQEAIDAAMKIAQATAEVRAVQSGIRLRTRN